MYPGRRMISTLLTAMDEARLAKDSCAAMRTQFFRYILDLG